MRDTHTHTHTHTHTQSSCCTLNELHKSILAIYPAISIKLEVKSCLILTGRVLQYFRFINVVTVSGTKKWRINVQDLFDTLNSRLSDSKHHTHTQIGQSGVLTERTASDMSLFYLSSWSSQAVRSADSNATPTDAQTDSNPSHCPDYISGADSTARWTITKQRKYEDMTITTNQDNNSAS